MKYLIIGASGLVGSYLIPSLCQENFVYGLSRSPINYESQNFKWLRFDLLKPFSEIDLPKDIDGIIYLAQSEYFRDFPNKNLELFNVNVVRYLEILNFALSNNIKTVVYASSGGVYEQCGRVFSENDRLSFSDELGFYLGSKICGEVLSSSFSNMLSVQILRFFFIYGPGQKSNMLMPRLISSIKERKVIQLDDENGITINPVHVYDAVSAIHAVLKMKQSSIYNIAGDEMHTLRKICELMGNLLGIKPIFQISNQQKRSKKICGDIAKIKKIGWEPRIDMLSGLKTLI